MKVLTVSDDVVISTIKGALDNLVYHAIEGWEQGKYCDPNNVEEKRSNIARWRAISKRGHELIAKCNGGKK